MISPAFPPAFILNHSPEIIVAFEMDFLRNSALFQKAIPRGKKFTMHLQPGWSAEIPEASAELKKRLAEAQKVFPEARFIFPANTYREMEILKEFSEVYAASHNAFFDPSRYPLAKKKIPKFKALYIAHITPFKRHFPAEKIKSLHLTGNYTKKGKEYFENTIRLFPRAVWTKKVPPFLFGKKSCETSCGLALSSIEGAMFSSREYSLCGIPAVNTGNLEGRDMRLPDFSIRYTADNTESVAENAEYRVTHPVEPEAIREEFLRLVHPPQKQIQDPVNTIAGKKVNLPHKRNIRCRMLPHNKLLHGIRRPLQ